MTVQSRIAQINYPWTPLFHSRAGEVAAQISEKLPQMAVSPDRWRFKDPDHRRVGAFSAHDASITWEALLDPNTLLTHAREVFEIVTAVFEVEHYSRVGYRVLVLHEAESFEQARQQICKHIFGEDQKWGPLETRPDDLLVVLENEGLAQAQGRRVVIAPIRAEEFATKYRTLLAFPEAVKEEIAFLIDVDVWLRDQEEFPHPLRQLLEYAEALCHSIVEQWFTEGD